MNSIRTGDNRIWEIDFIRGLAIILMIIFHLIVDLKEFYGYKLEYLRGFWYLEGKVSAILFIVICGVSSTLGQNNTRHGIKVLLWAMLLTIITNIYNPDVYIRFGILHFLGICLLSANTVHHLHTYWLIFIGIVIAIISIFFSQVFVSTPYLFPFGLITSTFISLDFYPLFPWYGVFLFGIISGKILYIDKKSLMTLRPPKIITWLGQHSLAVYLTHQPILLTLLYFFHGT